MGSLPDFPAAVAVPGPALAPAAPERPAAAARGLLGAVRGDRPPGPLVQERLHGSGPGPGLLLPPGPVRPRRGLADPLGRGGHLRRRVEQLRAERSPRRAD